MNIKDCTVLVQTSLIHFIIEMLKHPEKAMHIFLYDRIPDDEVEKYRKIYFNSPE